MYFFLGVKPLDLTEVKKAEYLSLVLGRILIIN